MTKAHTAGSELLALADKLQFAANNTEGCLYSQRKMLTDAEQALRTLASGADRSGEPDKSDITDALMDSQYIAGAKAGWNAAQADNPNEAYEKIIKSREGYLKPIRDRQKLAATPHNEPVGHALSSDTKAGIVGSVINWPEPKITNPDIVNPTGVAYLDGLIHQLLDAQQDINFEANNHMSQSLCDAAALIDEVEKALRMIGAATPIVSNDGAGADPSAVPLVWNEYEREGVIDEWDAETSFGTFYNVQMGATSFTASYDSINFSERFYSVEDAKAKCQADYSRRVAQALTATPPDASAGRGDSILKSALFATPDDIAASTTLIGASAGRGGERARYRHKKRGTTYEVIGRGSLQGEPDTLTDMANVVIYQCETDGEIWVRPESEFNDGRFEELNPPREAQSHTSEEKKV